MNSLRLLILKEYRIVIIAPPKKSYDPEKKLDNITEAPGMARRKS